MQFRLVHPVLPRQADISITQNWLFPLAGEMWAYREEMG